MSTFPVELAVYDLSGGMARQLSAQFLGPQFVIDIIPHTAILVYGREYFFGGGIQHEDPSHFRRMRGIHPVQVISLGNTSVSRDEFHTWCQNCTHSGEYAPASYDLLAHNCNNFSHDAALRGLKLPSGVPDWILDVPRKFLSSPMGQMVRPMLENMQMRGGADGASAPFSDAPTSAFLTATTTSGVASSNPWANIPETTPKTASVDGKDDCKPSGTTIKKTPVLDSHCKPLVSSEYKTTSLCVKKISAVLEEATDQEALEILGRTLATTHRLDEEEVDRASRIILKVLKSSASNVITFALMLLRVIVLESTGAEKAVKECLEWIEQYLTSSDKQLKVSDTAQAMAWLTLANAASLPWWCDIISEKLLDALFVDWTNETQPRAEIRQAAAAFSYNYVLQPSSMPPSTADQGHELTDVQVSLLCGSLESIAEETDATTQLRRLLVASRILVPKDSNAPSGTVRALMQDLGFADVIQDIGKNSTNGVTKDASKCKALACELSELIQ